MCAPVPPTSVQAPRHNGRHRPCGNGSEGVYYTIFLRGTDDMASLTPGTISRVEHVRSRQLIRDSGFQEQLPDNGTCCIIRCPLLEPQYGVRRGILLCLTTTGIREESKGMANTRATRVFRQGVVVTLFALVYFGAGILSGH